jgi:hypothetical protein
MHICFVYFAITVRLPTAEQDRGRQRCHSCWWWRQHVWLSPHIQLATHGPSHTGEILLLLLVMLVVMVWSVPAIGANAATCTCDSCCLSIYIATPIFSQIQPLLDA